MKNRIRELRKAKRLTMTELAVAAGVSVPYMYDLEMGRRGAKPETLYRIAVALECTVEDLLSVA